MAISIRTVINQALQEPGIIGWDDVADGDDAAMALSVLNQTLAQLNTEQLLPFSRRIVEAPVVGALDLTIGDTDPASSIVAARPLFINRLYHRASASDAVVEVQARPVAQLIGMRPTSGTTGFPSYYAYNPTYPAGTIMLDVIPSTGTLIIVYNAVLETLTSANATPEWPGEYQELITMALARRLASRKQMPADTLANVDNLYKAALNRVKTLNGRTQVPHFGGYSRNWAGTSRLIAGV
jgi:hypothetical protein